MANNEKTRKTCYVVGPVDIHKKQELKSTDWEECTVINTNRNSIRPVFGEVLKDTVPVSHKIWFGVTKISGLFERYVIVYAHVDKLSRL